LRCILHRGKGAITMGKRKAAAADAKGKSSSSKKKGGGDGVALPKIAGKDRAKRGGRAPAEKKARSKTMQERAGLNFSPNRCHRILATYWRGGKIAREADVVMAALLQHFAEKVLSLADIYAGSGDGVRPITCSELQRAIATMEWPEKSGLLKVHIMGAALGDDPEDENAQVVPAE
jgi:hypothetical protein